MNDSATLHSLIAKTKQEIDALTVRYKHLQAALDASVEAGEPKTADLSNVEKVRLALTDELQTAAQIGENAGLPASAVLTAIESVKLKDAVEMQKRPGQPKEFKLKNAAYKRRRGNTALIKEYVEKHPGTDSTAACDALQSVIASKSKKGKAGKRGIIQTKLQYLSRQGAIIKRNGLYYPVG